MQDRRSAAIQIINHLRVASAAALNWKAAQQLCDCNILHKGLMAWKLSHHICVHMNWQIKQADVLRSTLLCTNAFQSWLLFCAQRLRQQLAVAGTRKQAQRRMMRKTLFTWSDLILQLRTTEACKIQSALVFRSTYVAHVSLTGWHGWVRP
jgi:hypothetical protein